MIVILIKAMVIIVRMINNDSNASNINDDDKTNSRYHTHICNMIMKITVITMMMMVMT